MPDVPQLIAAAPPDHALRHAPEPYVLQFIEAASSVYDPRQLERILREKFQLDAANRFGLDSYLQSAAELSLQFHLRCHPRVTNLAIEKQVNPPKNVEAYYEVEGTRVSIEVKCASETDVCDGAMEVRTAGRVPEHQQLFQNMADVLREADSDKQVQLGKNKDNTLKDFLTSAHSKFSPQSGVGHLNVLVVACGDRSNMQQWHMYLTARQGLFAPGSFVDPSEFELVDVVILTNLKYQHTRGQRWHDWTLRDVLLVPLLNPRRRRTSTSSSIVRGLSVFAHHLQRFGLYARRGPADLPDALEATKILGFIGEALTDEERGRYFPAGL